MVKKIKMLTWYQVFKYAIYLLLSYNVYLFLRDDLANSSVMFSNGLSLKNIIVSFSGTIDTAAWVILLFVFELETYIINDDKLKGNLKWVLKIVSGFCYAMILYSFYGYVKKYFWFFDFEMLSSTSSIANYIGHSWLIGFDEFTKITQENINILTDGSQLYNLPKEEIITDINTLKSAKRVALIDVFNSFAWLVVVIVLEIDVWLQLDDKLGGRIRKVNNIIKIIAYIILIITAVSWGISGIILDTWDAILWILAFLFIEMNIFKWQKDIDEKKLN